MVTAMHQTETKMKSYLALAFICGLAKALPVAHEANPIDIICPPPSEEGLVVFVPHPYECSKYFVCQEGSEAIAMTCPGKLQFDVNLNICNYALEVGCMNTPYPTEPTTTMEPATTTPEDDDDTTVVPEVIEGFSRYGFSTFFI